MSELIVTTNDGEYKMYVGTLLQYTFSNKGHVGRYFLTIIGIGMNPLVDEDASAPVFTESTIELIDEILSITGSYSMYEGLFKKLREYLPKTQFIEI